MTETRTVLTCQMSWTVRPAILVAASALRAGLSAPTTSVSASRIVAMKLMTVATARMNHRPSARTSAVTRRTSSCAATESASRIGKSAMA